MTTTPQSPVLQAIEALKKGERRQAASLLRQELQSSTPTGDRWRSISKLAAQIGEIEIAIDASRRSVSPTTLDRLLDHWAILSTYGRSDEALEEVARLPDSAREHPSVLHFRGTIATERGRFEEAEELFRRALSKNGETPATWFALSMIKTFAPGDQDIAAMEKLADGVVGKTPEAQARFHYALGKARDDCGDLDRAFSAYERGAAIRGSLHSFDAAAAGSATDRMISENPLDAFSRLKPSKASDQRSIFVTGLPRTGTTLVEQILTSHSHVVDGAEVNLFRPALIPTLDYSMTGALAYQQRSASDDPWGDIAADYFSFVDMRFRSPGRIVDKSLGQTILIGLLLHSLPEAHLVWLQRDAQDAALSCFRTYFTGSVPWSWSWSDIASHFRSEERLIGHWLALFPGRILVVPYEELVKEPRQWSAKIQRHVGLAEEEIADFHLKNRTVTTASVRQVREPVSTSRIGQARAYASHMEDFRRIYEG